jgi:hypothetical protein
MSEALQASNLGAEAAAFVAAGAAGAAVAATPPPAPAPAARANRSPVTVPVAAPTASESPFVHSPLPVERRAPVSMTFRLPAELPSALLRVAMERKLRGEDLCTQQAIVAHPARL